jgi:phosphoenolpyruvate carboxylase
MLHRTNHRLEGETQSMNKPAPAAPVDSNYIDEITVMLRDLLRQVIRLREPRVLAVIDRPEDAAAIPADLVEHALQVIGIWLQLLNIAEENGAMRARRRLESQGGPDQVTGSFSNALSVVAAAGATPEAVQRVLDTLDVQPTLTAHPTEAKRVTVLEIHRRIYLKLYELESPRWTRRERQALVAALRNEIDLLWMTGEIRLEKPTVEQEVHWGLHFFREALYDRTSALCDLLEAALLRHYPELPASVRAAQIFLLDRRRPTAVSAVTVEVTRRALREPQGRRDPPRQAAKLAQLMSISVNEATVRRISPPSGRAVERRR